MFKKVFVLLFLLIFTAKTMAGIYEDALSKHSKVFLYFYSPGCRTCEIFDKTYATLKSEYGKDYGFVKINVETPYGAYLIRKFKGRYVPFIILTDSKTKKSVNINHTCIMDSVCCIRAMRSFKG